ncbi:hypothetical protein E1B28_013472 [Marasmius oreades]|uniref:Uncharacterized protein n=1 Tax=Marasmius oreades TaxID=181124 RepID=A0A9P7UP22_9AGAR|nr:uncharacterized protein E1B28_013472 [Marasmius oreades]KAG7087511.1 hypothetical protein E1B28_013472 [Marasmius oreades]
MRSHRGRSRGRSRAFAKSQRPVLVDADTTTHTHPAPPPPRPSTSRSKIGHMTEAFHNMLHAPPLASAAHPPPSRLPMSQSQQQSLSHSKSLSLPATGLDRQQTSSTSLTVRHRSVTPMLSEEGDELPRKRKKQGNTSIADLTEPLYPSSSCLDSCSGPYRSEAAKVGCNRVERNTIRLENQVEQELQGICGDVERKAVDLKQKAESLEQRLHALERSSPSVERQTATLPAVSPTPSIPILHAPPSSTLHTTDVLQLMSQLVTNQQLFMQNTHQQLWHNFTTLETVLNASSSRTLPTATTSLQLPSLAASSPGLHCESESMHHHMLSMEGEPDASGLDDDGIARDTCLTEKQLLLMTSQTLRTCNCDHRPQHLPLLPKKRT